MEHADDSLSDIDRKVLEDLLQKTEDMLKMYSQVMGPTYEEQMKQAEAQESPKGAFEKQTGYVKRFSMPQALYQIFKQMKPDGIPFDQNDDFMKYAQVRYPMFHRFKLMSQKWENVCNGVSQAGGPLPKAERDKINAANALILNEAGQMVKA
jgi:hypothetical protein